MLPFSVFITGAKSGIGLEFVRQFASSNDAPSHIFASGRKATESEELVKLASEHKNVNLVDLDVSNDEDIQAAVAHVAATVGDHGLNLLINNAAVLEAYGCVFPSLERDRVNRHVDVNATSPLILTQAFLPLLKKAATGHSGDPMSISKAAIINISSEAGSLYFKWPFSANAVGELGYVVSKAALNMVTKLLAMELKDQQILVAGICPGYVDSKMTQGALDYTRKTDQKVPCSLDESRMATPTKSVSQMMQVLCRLTDKHHGGYFRRNGSKIEDRDFESAMDD